MLSCLIPPVYRSSGERQPPVIKSRAQSPRVEGLRPYGIRLPIHLIRSNDPKRATSPATITIVTKKTLRSSGNLASKHPLFDIVESNFAGRQRQTESARSRLLQSIDRRIVRRGNYALRHVVPLGSPSNVSRPRWVHQSGYRWLVQRVRGTNRDAFRRPGKALDHAERTFGIRLPGPCAGSPCTRPG